MEESKLEKHNDTSIVLRCLHLHKEDHSKSRRFVGMVLMATAGVFLTSGNCFFQYILVALKKNHIKFSVFQMLFLRMLIGVVFCIPIMIGFRIHPYGDKKRNVFLLLLMGAAEVGAILCMYLALEKLPVGDATAIKFTAPIFTGFLGYVVLRQECNIIDILFGAASFFGVIMVAKPDWFDVINFNWSHLNSTCAVTTTKGIKHHAMFDSMEYFKGALFALSCSILLSTYFLMNTMVGRSQNIILAVFYPSLVGVITSPLMMWFSGDKVLIHELNYYKWGILVAVGIIYFFGMLFMAEAFQMDNLGPVVLIRYCDVAFAFILEYFLIRACPVLATIAGVIVILSSTFFRTLFRLFGVSCGQKKKVIDSFDEEIDEKELLINKSDDS